MTVRMTGRAVFRVGDKVVESTALFDTGATKSFVDLALAEKAGFTRYDKPREVMLAVKGEQGTGHRLHRREGGGRGLRASAGTRRLAWKDAYDIHVWGFHEAKYRVEDVKVTFPSAERLLSYTKKVIDEKLREA